MPKKISVAEEAACWQAVLERDARPDRAFVYGVNSTRIYCRPSCPSRRPKREGARFFESPQAAKDAGFRACKRCRPDDALSTPVARVQEICRYLEAHENETFSLQELGAKFGLSPFHLQRTFKKIIGVSPREYSDARRLDNLKTQLQKGETVTNAIYEAGYGSSRALYERASSQLGMTPATYGHGGKGAQIRFSVAPCSLGFLLVATTPKGICMVSLGDDAGVLEAELRHEFPAANLQRDESRLQEKMQAMLNLLEAGAQHYDLPLDVRATAFQSRVWQALREIDRGQTRTYTQVAEAIGQPTAARAVARACATNPVSLIVPCHRVVREGGALAGYRWGLERKRKLLAREQQISEPEA